MPSKEDGEEKKEEKKITLFLEQFEEKRKKRECFKPKLHRERWTTQKGREGRGGERNVFFLSCQRGGKRREGEEEKKGEEGANDGSGERRREGKKRRSSLPCLEGKEKGRGCRSFRDEKGG